MSAHPRPFPLQPLNHQPTGSRFCSDPDCEYCKDLREAEEQLRQGKPISKSER